MLWPIWFDYFKLLFLKIIIVPRGKRRAGLERIKKFGAHSSKHPVVEIIKTVG